jgi:hypothetical protein
MANSLQPNTLGNAQSTITLQQILDKVRPLGDVSAVLNTASGYQLEPFITICTDVMNEIFSQPFPYKWNEVNLPLFYTNSFQQDYVLLNADGSSFFNVEWLERGICIEFTSNTLPKPWGYVECGREQTQATGSLTQIGMWNNPVFTANTLPNSLMYYGTWGATLTGSSSLGNDPGPGSVYTNPLLELEQTSNPITQIQDANGNLLALYTYGTEGSTAPLAAPNATPGTLATPGSGATTQWVVVDPNGTGIRLLPVPSQLGVVFQFRLVGQMPAPNFSYQSSQAVGTVLKQTLAPFPDKYEPYFRQGVIAQCYRYSTDAKVQAKFEKNYALWQKSLVNLRALQDRELEENRFTPERGIMGGGRSNGTFAGPFWPFNYPLQ